MTTDLTLGRRIAWYRQRRGMSQEVLAGMLGRTVSWLSKLENDDITLDRLSVLRAVAECLDIALGDLLAEPSLMEWTTDSGQRTVPALREVLMDYRILLGTTSAVADPTDLQQLKTDVDEVWSAYQDARFGFVVAALVRLIPRARAAVATYAGDERAIAAGRLALAYQVAASTLTKLGEVDLAWTASERGIAMAHESGNPVVIGSLLRSITHSLLSTGQYVDAVRITNDAADFFEPHLHRPSSTMLSVYGTALLAGAMASARAGDRETTRDFLNAASDAARRLGRDENKLWTAFGPTNVAIHRVSTAMELGDVPVALKLGPDLDTRSVPIERRARHSLEVARALTTAGRRDEALATVLDAEYRAPEQVRYHFLTRYLVQTWMRSVKGKPSLDLAQLATRLHLG
ncbi:XRE family transcriptional regulator [Nocardioides jejuensis]|uniref:XRE family transcriptional regulator n=2 Tax=Nocardioides jejuensis TaxID=2502782 RepID=A0A4R1CIT4_9ACTN|nr:XRE family transcriptional regulator [Nocardioides jejuensis]